MAIHCIRGARWVVAWDPIQQQHFFRQNIDVVFEDDRLVHLDPDYTGPADTVIDGRGFMVLLEDVPHLWRERLDVAA